MCKLQKLTFAVIAILATFSLQAQDRNNILKTNVIGYFNGQYQLVYERALTPNFSAQLSGGVIASQSEGASIINGTEYKYENQRSGFIAIPEVRWYPGANQMEGFFIGAFGRFRQVTNDLSDLSTPKGSEGIAQDLSRERKNTALGGGMTVGFQWISDGGITLDLFVGPQYKSRNSSTSYDITALNEKSVNENSELEGDYLFNQKFLDINLEENDGWGLRFGFHLGYAF